VTRPVGAARRQGRAVSAALAALLIASTAAALAQTTNPRAGRWKLKQDAPPPASNIMTYEPLPGGGMRVTVDSVGRDGRRSGWTYITLFDGRDQPIAGHPTADAAEARIVTDRVNEIVYKKAGTATQFLLNVLSEDGKTLTVTFRNPEGRITAVATYEKLP
jgi:hypothetical protein